MKRSRLKPFSDKRLKRKRETDGWRRNKIAEVGKCEVCQWRPGTRHPAIYDSNLCVHEIASGADRQKALDKPFAILVVCNTCNNTIHSWDKERQLAILKRERPEDYDFDAFCLLRGRRYDEDEVMAWMS